MSNTLEMVAIISVGGMQTEFELTAHYQVLVQRGEAPKAKVTGLLARRLIYDSGRDRHVATGEPIPFGTFLSDATRNSIADECLKTYRELLMDGAEIQAATREGE